MLLGTKKKRDRARRPHFTITWLKSDQLLRFGLLFLLTILLTVLFPNQQNYEYSGFRESTIAPAEIIAPQTFYVYKNQADYLREVASARREVFPVLTYYDTVQVYQKIAMDRFFADLKTTGQISAFDSLVFQTKQKHPDTGPISENTFRLILSYSNKERNWDRIKNATLDLLKQTYETGIMARKSDIAQTGQKEAILLRYGKEQKIALDNLLDFADTSFRLQETIKSKLPAASPADIKAVYELVMAFLVPNVSYNTSETNRRYEEAGKRITHIKGTVLKGERIIDEHDRITVDHIDKLNSLIDHINRQRQNDPLFQVLKTGAQAILCALVLAIFFGFLSISKPWVYRHNAHTVLFAIVILMPATIAHYANQQDALSPFLVPVALSAMLVTVLFDAEIGMVLTLVTSVICASILGQLQFGLVFIITGIIGAYSVRQVRHRSDFYRSIVFLVIAYTLTIATTAALLFTYASTGEFFLKIRQDLLIGLFTACASSVLTIGLLPIFESVFGVVTPITLLELSDLNRPLLRNLAIRAPGTYSHSMNMANISEAAADAIGADRLMVRVGCYYHDIGKMIRPHYFIENQKGINPHDELQPKMSALILISHVKDGIELAEEEGLPRAIVDLIPQHHGTSEIASFKHRALELGDKQSVRDEDFRYPGPKPQTKEAGIINLADAVESATRTLTNNSPDQIKGMVQTIIKGRFTSGELDECDLTLRDLTKIQEAFLPVLQASRHQRVPYPWQAKKQTDIRDRKKEGKERS